MKEKDRIIKNRFLVWLMWTPLLFCFGIYIYTGWTLAQMLICYDQLSRYNKSRQEEEKRLAKIRKREENERAKWVAIQKEEIKKEKEKMLLIERKERAFYIVQEHILPIAHEICKKAQYATVGEIIDKLNITYEAYYNIAKDIEKYMHENWEFEELSGVYKKDVKCKILSKYSYIPSLQKFPIAKHRVFSPFDDYKGQNKISYLKYKTKDEKEEMYGFKDYEMLPKIDLVKKAVYCTPWLQDVSKSSFKLEEESGIVTFYTKTKDENNNIIKTRYFIDNLNSVLNKPGSLNKIKLKKTIFTNDDLKRFNTTKNSYAKTLEEYKEIKYKLYKEKSIDDNIKEDYIKKRNKLRNILRDKEVILNEYLESEKLTSNEKNEIRNLLNPKNREINKF